MKKRIFSMLLILSLVLGLSVPVLATSNGLNVGYPAAANVSEEGNTVETKLYGTIKATQLKVTVPISVYFYVDNTKEIQNSTTQVTQPGNITVKNDSNVPVYIAIKSIAMDGVTLTDNPSNLKNTSKYMMFSITSTARPTLSFSTQSDWIMPSYFTGSNVFHLDSTYGKVPAASGAKSGELSMLIHARAEDGWTQNDTFTITPTFVVASDPTFGIVTAQSVSEQSQAEPVVVEEDIETVAQVEE